LALSRQGNLTRALAYARRAARYSDFKNLDILLTLTDAYEELGRYAEAADAADNALNVALNSNAQSAPQILKRLERLRIRARSPARTEDR
jgi:tetratricopeptide (TPR) repeat protein